MRARQLQHPFRRMGTREIKHAIKRAQAEIERQLLAHVQQQNREDAETEECVSITGASYLAQSIKDRVAKAKRAVEDAQGRVTAAVEQIDGAADSANAMATAIEQEAAELNAQMAQLTNGPPQ